MEAALIIVRIVVFLAVVVPLLVWVIRRAKRAREIPADRAVDHHTDHARAEWSAQSNRGFGGSGLGG